MPEVLASPRPPGMARSGPREDWVHSVLEAFHRAERSAGLDERFVTVGGHAIRQRFAGPELLTPLHSAFAVRRSAGDLEDLSVFLWDSATTGVPLPESPFSEETARTFSAEGITLVRHPTERTLFLWDARRRQAVYWVADSRAIPEWEQAAPMRLLLHWWTAGRPLQLVHSSAVGGPAGGVLLAGRGGSGKSTTALACFQAGLSYAGDDFVLAEIGPSPRVHALYGTGKLAADSLSRLPSFQAAILNPERGPAEKAILSMDRVRPGGVIGSFPLRAILLPRVSENGQTSWTRASAAEALGALAPSTLFQLSGGREESFRKMSELVRLVPSYRLELGSDLSAITGAVRELIERPGSVSG